MHYSSFLFSLYVISESGRSDLPDSAFGIPELRKYPLDTEAHVLSAIKFFNYVEPKYEEELAKNIIKKIHEFKLEDKVNPGETNRFSKYWKKTNVKENSIMEDDNKKVSIDEVYNDVKVANSVNIDEIDFSYCTGEPNSEVVFESRVFQD